MRKRETVSAEVLAKYKQFVNSVMVTRARVVVFIGNIFFMGFSYVDRQIFPPDHQQEFIIMRIIVCSFVLALFALSFTEKVKKNIVWIVDLGAIAVVSGMCYVVYKTEGASGKYYEGINQAMWAWLLANSFYYKHHIFVGGVTLALYTIAALANPAYWDLTKFVYSFTMIGITSFYVTLLSKFYESEFFYGFARNEALKESERQLAESNEKLSVLYQTADQMSKIDDLTKIYNRRYFLEVLTQKLRKYKQENTFFYLIIFDIDHFKEINDTYGHSVGDEVIRTVAQTVLQSLRANSYIGRYGGDEFMIIIDKADKDIFMKRIIEVKEAIQNAKLAHGSVKLVSGGKELKISVSVGALKVDPQKYDSVASIIELADSALLKVKQTKRGEINLIE